MNDKKYCPTCRGELEMLSGCGAVGYFCNHCRKLVSRSKMLSESDLGKAGEGTEGKPSDEKNDPMA